MNLLTIAHDGRTVEIAPEALAIPEFEAIWKRDDSVKKENARNALAYIYFSTDYNSIYLAYPEDVREKKIREDLGIRKLTKEIKAGIMKYKELQNTPTMGYLVSARRALESMKEYFDTVDWSERDLKGAPIYKPKEVSSCLKDAGGIQDSLDKLIEKVKAETYEKSTAKGGATVNHFEE